MRPSQLAAIMQPELPDLAREIIAEIRDKIPEYARPMNGPYGLALRVGVQQALTSFFESVADPAAPHEERDQMCRRLGQYEALEGRSLDSLQAAYRTGVHVAWRRVMDVGLRCGAPSSVMSMVADRPVNAEERLKRVLNPNVRRVDAATMIKQQDKFQAKVTTAANKLGRSLRPANEEALGKIRLELLNAGFRGE